MDIKENHYKGIMEMIKQESPEMDLSGLETLELFSHAREFNAWMFGEVRPYCQGSILEIGSGIGNISAFLLEEFQDVTLSDLKPEYCRRLEQTYGQCQSLKRVLSVDLATAEFERVYAHLMGRFDTVIALNVVEHIQDDVRAVRNAAGLLKRGGRMVILVPAYQWLFNDLDKNLGHYRRYTRKRLTALLEGQQLEMLTSHYFNAAAIAGWWMAGSVLRMARIGKSPLNWYNRLVGIMRVADRLLGKRVGMSVVGIATKEAAV